MKAEYEALIAEIDGILHEARAMWVEAHDADKPKRMGRINDLLDRRISLMKGRAAATAINA